jgi:hypothetical protein
MTTEHVRGGRHLVAGYQVPDEGVELLVGVVAARPPDVEGGGPFAMAGGCRNIAHPRLDRFLKGLPDRP